jgi:hypothetical protein
MINISRYGYRTSLMKCWKLVGTLVLLTGGSLMTNGRVTQNFQKEKNEK